MRTADGLRFGCPGCGSGLRYDIASGRMRCDSCGQSYALSDIPDPSKNAADGKMDAAEYRCPQCGAAVHTSQTAAASFCSYCGADVILTERLTRITRPSAIVPFKITREECEAIYRRRVKEARFAPDDFGAQETVSHFRPVYIPFWRYSGSASGAGLSGSATHRHSDSRYDYTDVYAYRVDGGVRVTDVIYDASVSFEDETARQLSFSTKRAVPFHPACLCGFYAESPDTEPTLYKDGLRKYAEDAWKKEFDKKCEYGSAKVAFPEPFEADAELMLMPVWLLAHRSGGRVVYTAINGDSGQIVCDTPISNRRFAVLGAECTAVILAALLLVQAVLVLRPRLLAALCGLIAAVAQWIIARVSKDLAARSLHEDDYTWQKLRGKKTDAKKKPRAPARGIAWWLPPLVTAGVAGAGAVIALMNSYDTNAFLATLFSDHAWLPWVVQGCALIFFVASGYKRTGGIDGALYFARLAIMGVTLAAIFLATGDLPFYGCCIALLTLTAPALARLNRSHNAYVSRPVPFFGEAGEQA